MKRPVTISVEEKWLAWMDELVAAGVYANRSAVVEAALMALKDKHEDDDYVHQLSLLDPVEEKALAEEGMADYSKLVLDTTEWNEGALDRAI